MATWKLSPQYKKSAVEKMFFYNDGKVITIEQGFRWATFSVESADRPLTDEELKNEDGYELGSIANDESWEMWDMIDGCWLDIEKGNDKVTDQDLEEFEHAWEEDGYEAVEYIGWSQDDTEYYYHGPLELTNEDTGEVFKGEPDESDMVVFAPPPVQTPEQKAELDEIVKQLGQEYKDKKAAELEENPYTDWYPASIDPVRNGTYQVLHGEYEEKWPFPSNVKASVWNGTKWDDSSVVQWRGLTKETK